MAHDPALEAHEHTEHAEHAAHESDPFIARVAITVAILAVLAAVSGSLETVEDGRALAATSKAVLEQDQATDAWNEYQADSLKRHMYSIAADQGGPREDEYKKKAKEQDEKQDELKKTAHEHQAARDEKREESEKREQRHYWLTGAATLFEIGIAMSTVAIITRRHWLWQTAVGFACAGVLLFAAGYIV
jgi:cation transport ATPase